MSPCGLHVHKDTFSGEASSIYGHTLAENIKCLLVCQMFCFRFFGSLGRLKFNKSNICVMEF